MNSTPSNLDFQYFVTAILQGLAGSVPFLLLMWRSWPTLISKIDGWLKELKEIRQDQFQDNKIQLLTIQNTLLQIKTELIKTELITGEIKANPNVSQKGPI